MTDDAQYALRMANGESLSSILDEVRNAAHEIGYREGRAWATAQIAHGDG